MAPDAFLAWEREQPIRHVYVRGAIFAMSGGSPRHSLLSSRSITLLSVGLATRPCDVHTADLRIGVEDDHFVYADAVVVCRPVALRPGSTDVVTNPKVVVEVLSKSTESYDRGDKQAAYLALPSLSHYVLVSQRTRRVEVYSSAGDGSFHFTVHGAGDTVTLGGIGVTLSLDELYQGVFDLPGDEDEAPSPQ